MYVSEIVTKEAKVLLVMEMFHETKICRIGMELWDWEGVIYAVKLV